MVLDGDIDDSATVVTSAAEHLPVRGLTFATNRGRAAALNAGFAACVGDVVVRCDDDLVPRADYLSRHLEACSHGDVGVIGLYRNVYPETAYARVYGRAWDAAFRREAYSSPEESTWRYWAGNASVTRAAWERVGGYDEAFQSYGYEDVDWGYRLAATGVPIVLDPRLETEHRIAATTCASRAQRAFYSGAARARFERKHSLGERTPPAATPWNRMVSTVAARLSEQRAQRAGRAVDAAAGIIPAPAAGKVVSMLVEASELAGHQAATTAGQI